MYLTFGKTQKKTDHILVDERQHSYTVDVRSFRGADCDTGHYLMVAKVRDCQQVNEKRKTFIWKDLNDVVVKKEYQVRNSNSFAAACTFPKKYFEHIEELLPSAIDGTWC
jgi:hypothetical protein